MLTIRQNQFDAFLLQDEEKLIDFIVEHLQNESLELIDGIPLDILREQVEFGLSKARKYGFTRPNDLTAFVSIMFEISPDFDEHPPIHRVFTDESIPINKRFDAIFERVSEEEWEKINYNEKAWFPELWKEREAKT
jgi:hypothetical protein